MLWLGIGVLIIGVALLIVAIAIIKPLLKLSGVFGSLQKTTDTLPSTVHEITTQAKGAIGTGVDTLHQVNEQVKELSPLFHTIGDIGRSTNKLTSQIVSKVTHTEEIDADGTAHKSNGLQGLYGLIALLYLLFNGNKK
ncbi:DUF948 domain-containing protein [Oceanobacillus bengalensis]|uniref:DUF948 domain-containing protein n=1 Tax=Oceanobacillus bengalensis TaxID=1435466 RepID=A0A494YVP9_9BACI|nr:DUF948 domain-containing protein [Oceanobacillus bengalensis]RKQ14225.1 DUF948 domain-containing protein [Oceanobacillus bengalensis]